MMFNSLVTHRHTRAGGYPEYVGASLLANVASQPVGGCSAICSCIALLPTFLSELQATPKKLREGAQSAPSRSDVLGMRVLGESHV